MIIRLVEKIIQKRNSEFSFDEKVNLSDEVSIVTKNVVKILRILKLLMKFRIPSLLFIERGVKFYGVRNMKWGKWVQIGEFATLISYGSSELSIGNNVILGSLSRFIVTCSFADTGRHIRIGNNFRIPAKKIKSV